MRLIFVQTSALQLKIEKVKVREYDSSFAVP